MRRSPRRALFFEAMAKHLPPSASRLRLFDLGGEATSELNRIRQDLDPTLVSISPLDWVYEPATIDAIVAFDLGLTPDFLKHTLAALRPGGRFVVVNPEGAVHERIGHQLEAAGFVRILVESAVDEWGVLIRGEKPHITADTHARVQTVADHDADQLDLQDYRGRYVFLLVEQRPNVPAWKLTPDTPITWEAVALSTSEPQLLAFSSLPKAVSFMQPAVMAGLIVGINKVAKFSKETALNWPYPVLLNATVDRIEGQTLMRIPIDPTTAEAPDE